MILQDSMAELCVREVSCGAGSLWSVIAIVAARLSVGCLCHTRVPSPGDRIGWFPSTG